MTLSKPRKSVLALLMSVMLPGFGQLYNGETNKAIWIFLVVSLVSIPLLAVVALHLPGGWMMAALLMSLGLTLATWIYSMIDAWRSARRQVDYQLKPWQVSGLYPLVFVLCNVIALPLMVGYTRSHQVESFRIPSISMEPTVLKGDFIFADKRYNCPNCKQGIARGDIVIFVNPNNRSHYYIKRIVALPGDRVQIAGNDVSINGKPLAVRADASANGTHVVEQAGGRQWKVFWMTKGATYADTDVVIPNGQVFVLGDNRGMSQDSRHFGPVPMADVIGKARQVWFSYDNSVRWDRLGKTLH